MIVYEVNIEVNLAIFKEYMAWLKPHIKELLALKGFLKADVFFDKQSTVIQSNKITVAYYLDTLQSYQDYLEKNATQLRQEALEKFGNQFRITQRRVLELEGSYSL